MTNIAKIRKALDALVAEQRRENEAAVARHTGNGPNYATGLASEGYVGGYKQALQDCLLALGGNWPDTRGWWPKDR